MDLIELHFLMDIKIKDDSEVSCSPACSNIVKFYRELNENFIREIEDLKYEGFQLTNAQKRLKEKIESQAKDYRRIQQEYSIKANQLLFAKEEIVKLTTEIGVLKAQFAEADFYFKKFETSSTVVENMLANHLKYTTEEKTKKGLGYNNVLPPFNHNYTPH